MGTITEGTLDLSDGRRLGYSEWGPAGAPPVIYCHGSPGNRLELGIARSVIERHGVHARVVAFDRPGFGLSTFRPSHRFVDWPGDVAEATDILGIERFALLGASGGSPFALACGRALGSRVTHIGIVVGSGPLEATGMRDALAITLPSSSGLLRRLQYGMIAYAFEKGREDRVIEQSIASMGEADQAAMERPEVRAWFGGLFGEAVKQGGRAAAYEAGLYRKPWGFDVSQVETPTSLWYGGKDEHVPASVGRWLAERIPNSSYVLWSDHGHFTWAVGGEVAEVVATLAEAGRRSNPASG